MGFVDHLGLSPSSRPTLDQQIKPHPTKWQYPLIKYLDNKDDSEDKKDENKKSAASGMVSRVSNIFAAMKKSVQKPKESKYFAETPESEMKVSLFFVTEKFKKLIFWKNIDKLSYGEVMCLSSRILWIPWKLIFCWY